MSARYFPLTLTDTLNQDGEPAQLLSITNSTPAPIAQAVPASPGRNGKMKVALFLQFPNIDEFTGGTLFPDDVITLVVRSPFAGDAGEQNHRPAARASYSTPDSFMNIGPLGGLPADVLPVVAADFSPTFNGKNIPNWTVVLTAINPSVNQAGVYVEIDFGATIAS